MTTQMSPDRANAPLTGDTTAEANTMHIRRNHERHRIEEAITAVDRMTGQVLGMVANLSLEGLMVAGPRPLASDSIFQLTLTFDKPVAGANALNLGVDCMWNSANERDPDLYWSGCQIIDLADKDITLLEAIIHAHTAAEA